MSDGILPSRHAIIPRTNTIEVVLHLNEPSKCAEGSSETEKITFFLDRRGEEIEPVAERHQSTSREYSSGSSESVRVLERIPASVNPSQSRAGSVPVCLSTRSFSSSCGGTEGQEVSDR